MKMITFLGLILATFTSVLNCQQKLSKDELHYYNKYLDSSWVIIGLVDDIIRNNAVETLPKIERIFWEKSCNNQKHFLKAMFELNSPKTIYYAKSYLDSLDNSTSEKYNYCLNKLEFKVNAIKYLYELNDFSRVDEVFELWERDKQDSLFYSNAIELMPYIYRNIPAYKDRAKAALLESVKTASGDFSLFAYTLYSVTTFGEEVLPEMIELFKTTEISQVKRAILEMYLSKYGNKFDLNGLLRQSIISEKSSPLRLHYSKVFLYGFSKLNDYKFVKDYVGSEPNDTIKSLIEFELLNYKPYKPDSTTPPGVMIDTLIRYNNQSYSFGWIPGKESYSNIAAKLDDVKSDLNGEGWSSALTKITSCRSYLDDELKQNNISEDAHKFLWHYAGYLEKRLENSTN